MEDFVLVVLSLAVLLLLIKARGRAADRKKLAEHNDLIGRLHRRVLVLEEAAQITGPATEQPAAEPVARGGPFPAAAAVARVEEAAPIVEQEPSTAQASFAPEPALAAFVAAPSEDSQRSQPLASPVADTAPQDVILPAPSAPYVPSTLAETSAENIVAPIASETAYASSALADTEPQNVVAPVPSEPYAASTIADPSIDVAAVPPVAPPLAPPPPPKRHVSFEERFGQNWLNKLGIVAVVIGLAGGLGLLLRTMGPAGRSAIGIALSLAILGGGVLLERKEKYRVFSRALIGGGWALTFFVTFALYHVTAMQVLQSQTADLVLMLIVAAAMVAHSLKYKSQVVTGLAFILAFVTVGISEVTMFSLVAGALLALGLVYVVAREYWFELGLVGLVGIYVNHFLWLRRVLPDGGQPGHPFPGFVGSAALLLFYWLIFRLFYVLRVPKTRRQELISSFSAILNSIGLMSLLKYQSSHPEWAFRGLLILGTAEFVFAFVARRKWRGAFVVLSTIASVLLLAAIPFHFGGSHWTLFWLLEAEVLFIAGLRLKEVVFRRLGMIAGFLTTAQLIETGIAPLFNYRAVQPDTSHHLHLTITLVSAAVLFWGNSEFCKRRWNFIVAAAFDREGLRVTSYIALMVATAALWAFFPGAWTGVAWLLAALALGWFADKLSSGDLAAQSDILALFAVIRVAGVNFTLDDHWHTLSLRTITVGLSGVLLYVAMRRKTPALGFKGGYIAPLYSWAAVGLLGVLIYYCVPAAWIVVVWLLGALVLAFLADKLSEKPPFKDFATQSDILAVCAVVRAGMVNLTLPDHWHGLSLRVVTIGLSGALLYVAMRRKTHGRGFSELKGDYIAPVYSWAAVILLGALVYLCVPAAWVIVVWLLGALVLAFFADRLSGRSPCKDFATQADILAVYAVVRAGWVNFRLTGHWHGLSLQAVTVGISVALLYVAMRRKTLARGFKQDYVAPAYSWAAAALFGTMLWYVLQPVAVAVGWAVFGLVLFEIGTTLRRSYFRYQGYVLLGASFVRLWISNLNVGDTSHFLSPRVYTVVPLIAAYFWVYWRLYGEQRQAGSSTTSFEQKISTIAPWLGTIAISALIYFEVRPDWVGIVGALFALVLLALAWWLQRTVFVAQSLVLLLAAAVREGMFHLFSPEPLATAITSSRFFCVGGTCVLMLLTLPLAFRVRGQLAERAAGAKPGWRKYTLFRPEQLFFFIPFVLLAVLLFIQLHAGMITTGWVVLGLLTFLFALAVRERSYRLAGLSLLMLGVCKVIAYDIWHLSLTYRYFTLVVMGVALLLVSFLYSRYKETILKFL